MKKIEIIPKKENEEILEKMKNQYGIENIKGILLRKGKERIFLFQGEIPKEKISEFDSLLNIERAGVYIGKIFLPTNEMRLSIEGTQIFKKSITKNIYELSSEEDYERWMSGQELQIKTGLKGMVVIKYKEEFLGCGKASEEKIGNFIPKNRRLKLK
jgi:NOL1/NOP2/fmu family ribosome biogenesis protein